MNEVVRCLGAVGIAALVAACSGSSSTANGGSDGGSNEGDGGASGTDGSASDGASSADGADGGGGIDGTPTRQACVTPNGTAITTSFGRLDGYLVALVPPGQHSCNGDSDHLHLQVKANGAIYDVAINMKSQQDPTNPDVFLAERDLKMPGGAWAEGWHAASDDYVQLGLHSTDFTQMPLAQLAAKVEADLGPANHISVLCTGYGPTGCHDVHRRGGNTDGAIVMNPLSPASHLFFFHFAAQTF